MPKRTATAKDGRALKVFSVILGMALAVGYGGLRAARVAEASRIQVAKKRAALEVEIHRLKEISAAKRHELVKFKALRTESPWSVTAGERHSPNGPNDWVVTAQTADMIRMRLTAYRAGLANTYGALYRSLGLMPAEIDAFEDLMTGSAETMYDLDVVTVADGLDGASPELAELKKQAVEELRAEQRALLGDAGYRQLQQFNRVEPIQRLVEVIANATNFPPEPLTDSQAQRLAVVVENASSSYQNGGMANGASVDWSSVLAQAAGLLSANQMHGLQLVIDGVKLSQFQAQFFQRERGQR